MAKPKPNVRKGRRARAIRDLEELAPAPPAAGGDARNPGDGGDAGAGGGDAPRTEGQRLLLALAASAADIARAVGASKQTVSRWRRGEKVPAFDARPKLEAAYQIPAASWERAPTGSKPPDVEAAKAAVAGLSRKSTLEDVVRVQEFLEGLFYDAGLAQGLRLQFVDPLTKVLNLRRAVERDQEQAERERTFRDARTVREHPELGRLLRLAVGAIKCRDCLASLRKELEADGLRGVS